MIQATNDSVADAVIKRLAGLDAAIDRIFDRADDLCQSGKWAELDGELMAVDVKAITPSEMLTWLGVTVRALREGHLSEWVGLVDRVEAELSVRGRPVFALMRYFRRAVDSTNGVTP